MTKNITKIYNEIKKTNSSDGNYCVDYSFFWWLDNKQAGTSSSLLSQKYFWRIKDARAWLNKNQDIVVDQLAF